MSKTSQAADEGVIVRFWSLDHHRAEPIVWPVSDWPKLVYAAAGTLQVESQDRMWILPANRGLWVPAGIHHRATTLGRARVRTLYLAPDAPLPSIEGAIEVAALLREIIVEICRSGPLMTGNKRQEALATLLRSELEFAPRLPSEILLPRTDWVREWCRSFLSDPEGQGEITYSARTLERRLKEETGLSAGRWRSHARAVLGLRALSTGSTVQEAAMAAGFATASGFVHSFKRQFGFTPGQIGLQR